MKRIGYLCLAAALAMGCAQADTHQHGPFPDFGFKPPASEYSGPLFRLSQNYPTTKPDSLPAFFSKLPAQRNHDFQTWNAYLMAARDYCLDGNAQVNWDVQKNTQRHWYHMPWQHYGPMGREGIHGLTKEAPISPQELAATQHSKGQTYAVGIFNAQGGYTLGRVWKDPQHPDLSVTSAPNSFPDGTVICKALFVTVPVAEVPSLTNPLQWQAYVTTSFDGSDREVEKVALIQMDVAIRDSRIPATGWLFGTFQYNGENRGKASWDNLVPVGIMWGNDPGVTANDYTNPKPTQTQINPNLTETAINPGSELPPTHLGWNGRLAGPVDNAMSSCMSCHMTAEYPQRSQMNPTFKKHPPKVGSKAWMRWFQNIPAGVPFDKGSLSTDYSLQLAQAVQNFYDWKCNEGGVFDGNGNACSPNNALQLKAFPTKQGKVYPILRNVETDRD